MKVNTLSSTFCFVIGFTLYAQAQITNGARAPRQEATTRGKNIPYGNNPQAGRYVQAGDARLYYEVYGQGKPLLLLHSGVVGSIAEMAPFIDSLSPSYQVIAVTTRGHGKSEIGHLPVTYEQKAYDILAVIRAVTQDSVMVLGFSDGAYTGYKLASMYPEQVKKLIAIGVGEQVPGLRKVILNPNGMFSQDKLYMRPFLNP